MSIRRRCTETGSVKRPVVTANKRDRSAATTVLSGLRLTKMFPSDPNRLGVLLAEGTIQTIYNMFDVYVLGLPAILVGDILVSGETEYTVRAVALWQRDIDSVTQLTIELIKQ